MGARGVRQPRHEAHQVDGNGREHMLQMGLGQAHVAGAPHLVGAHALGQRALDAGAQGLLGGEGGGALTVARGQERLVFLPRMQGELARLCRAARAARPRRTGPTGGSGELDADNGGAILLPCRQPLGTRAPQGAGHALRVPIDRELRRSRPIKWWKSHRSFLLLLSHLCLRLGRYLLLCWPQFAHRHLAHVGIVMQQRFGRVID
jgi:hypothetical protein